MSSKGSINWLALVLDLLVVFMGITAAFMLENMKDIHKSKSLEKKYLKSFSEDLLYDQEELQSTISINDKKIQIIQKYLQDETNSQKPDENAVIAVFAEIMSMYGFNTKNVTYESYRNSGNLEIIEDYSLREAITAYYLSINDKDKKEFTLTKFISDFAIPFVYENMNLQKGVLINVKKIDSIKLNNLIFGYLILLEQNTTAYKQLLAENQELTKKLTSK